MQKEENCLNVSGLTDFLYEKFNGAPEGIIFDCDGVLVDSVSANIQYYCMLREGVSLPSLTQEQKDFCQMSTVDQAIDYIIPKALQPLLGDLMRKKPYDEFFEPQIKASKNLHTFLNLCQGKILLGIHTNRINDINPLLQQCNLDNIFDPVMTADKAAPKPNPLGSLLIIQQWNIKPERILFIGDSRADRDTARAANIPFLPYDNPDLVENVCCCDFAHLKNAFEIIWNS